MAISRNAATVMVATIIVVGLTAQGAILFYVEEPTLRIAVGLLALLPVMWALVWGTRQGLAEEPLTAPLRKRRYFKLRAKVRQMIEEVTRLNWTIVDGKRGLRQPDEVKRDADAIEERLHKIIQEVRESAGEISEDKQWD